MYHAPRVTRLLALIGIIGISFSAIFVRLAGVSPSTAAIYRTGYAIPLLLLGWILTRRSDHRPRLNRWLALLAGGLLGVDLTVWHRAIEHIGAGLATVLGNTQIVFVAILAWLLHGEKPSPTARVTVPLVFAGVILISGLGRADAYGARPLLGVLFGILTGITYSGFLILFRYSNRGRVPSVGPLLDATVGAFVASFALAPLDPHLDLRFHWPAHGWLIALALVAQVGGWLLITSALPRLPALDTSVMLPRPADGDRPVGLPHLFRRSLHDSVDRGGDGHRRRRDSLGAGKYRPEAAGRRSMNISGNPVARFRS